MKRKNEGGMKEVLITLTDAQIEMLRRISEATKQSRSALMRQATNMVIGSYKNALNK